MSECIAAVDGVVNKDKLHPLAHELSTHGAILRVQAGMWLSNHDCDLQ